LFPSSMQPSSNGSIHVDFPTTSSENVVIFRHKHIKPPKYCSHKYNLFIIIFFGNVWTSHLGLFLFVLSIFD
jgi:hypothetical protein